MHLTATTGPPPVRVPTLRFVPIASVTFPVKPVTVFPAASSAVTFTAGVIAAPAWALLGWWLIPRCVAGGGGGDGVFCVGGGGGGGSTLFPYTTLFRSLSVPEVAVSV